MTFAQSPRLIIRNYLHSRCCSGTDRVQLSRNARTSGHLGSAKQSALDYLRASGDGLNYKCKKFP